MPKNKHIKWHPDSGSRNNWFKYGRILPLSLIPTYTLYIFSSRCASTKPCNSETSFCSVWELWNCNSNIKFQWLPKVLQTFNLCIFYSFAMQYPLPVQNLLYLSGSVFRTGVQPLTEIMQLKVQMTEVYKTMTYAT